MRTDLTEEDHPINLVVSAFQRIILEEVGKIKAQLSLNFSSHGPQSRTISRPIIVEELHLSNEEEKTDSQRADIYRMPTGEAKKQALLGNRGTYLRQTLRDLPQEAKFAEVVIAEVKKLVCMLYGTLIRFYIPVLKYEDLHDMREDLIELLTSLTVRGDLSKLLL